jgi:hypothetical protein
MYCDHLYGTGWGEIMERKFENVMTPPQFPFVQCVITPIHIECEKNKIDGPVAWARQLPSCMIWHHIAIEDECIQRDVYTSVDVSVVKLLLGLRWWRNDPRREARRRKRSVLSIDFVSRRQGLCLSHIGYCFGWFVCHGHYCVIGAMGAYLLWFFIEEMRYCGG